MGTQSDVPLALSTLRLLHAAGNGDKGLRCLCRCGHTRHSSPHLRGFGLHDRRGSSLLAQPSWLSSLGGPLLGQVLLCSGSNASCLNDVTVCLHLNAGSGWGRSGLSDDTDEPRLRGLGMNGSEQSCVLGVLRVTSCHEYVKLAHPFSCWTAYPP